MKYIAKLVFIPLLSLASIASAEGIRISRGAGNIPAILAYDAETHAQAMAQALSEKPDLPAPKMRALRNKVRSTTLTVLEYTPPGWAHPLRIHARSGRSNASVIEQMRGSERGSTTGESDIDSTFSTPEEAAKDLMEHSYYPEQLELHEGFRPTAPVDIRAPIELQRVDGKIEASIIGDGRNHSGDAEIKALRKLENLFLDRTVPTNGNLKAYVSKTVCASCRNGFDTMAKEYGVSGEVFELNEVGTPVSAVLADTIQSDVEAASRASSKLLATVRMDIVNERLKSAGQPIPRTRWSNAIDLRDLDAAESESLGLPFCAD